MPPVSPLPLRDLQRGRPEPLVLSPGGTRAGEMGAGCVPREPQGLGHAESPTGRQRPQEAFSQVGPGNKQEEPFRPSPSLCSNRGALRLFPGGILGRFEHRTKRTQPPGLNLSALLPAHQPAPRCPHFCPGLLSASVYRSSKTDGGTGQMTPKSRQCPVLGLSGGQARGFGTGEEVGQTLRFTWGR